MALVGRVAEGQISQFQLISLKTDGMIPSQTSSQQKATKSLPGNGHPPIVSKRYQFLRRLKNPDFEGGVKFLEVGEAFESCLIHHNSDKSLLVKGYGVRVKTEPKWKTHLLEQSIDFQTGELINEGVYESNDFKQSNGRKIKKLDSFCAFYQPLYSSRKVTLWFLTFTRANHSRITWVTMVDIVTEYYKRLGIPVKGHIWTAEVSENMHWHYHLCIATNRVNMKGKQLPAQLKFEGLWGQRVQVDFVKKNVRHYMAKYFAKCEYRVMGSRSYGSSRKFL
jgi:hypothetical protein